MRALPLVPGGLESGGKGLFFVDRSSISHVMIESPTNINVEVREVRRKIGYPAIFSKSMWIRIMSLSTSPGRLPYTVDIPSPLPLLA